MSSKGRDVQFDCGEMGFSYRTAAVCITNNKILLQHEVGGDEYAFPGGQVSFGETASQALKRELREEMSADAQIGELLCTAEIFFEWNGRKYQQICLFFEAELSDDVPHDGTFLSSEKSLTEAPNLEFCWIPFDRIVDYKVYPAQVLELAVSGKLHKTHIIYKE